MEFVHSSHDTGYWLVLDPIWHSLSSTLATTEVFLYAFAATPREVGHLFATHWCYSEVCNGGFHQFFANVTGVLAPEALQGFEAIGVEAWAQALKESMAFFDEPYPRAWEDRQRPLKPGARIPDLLVTFEEIQARVLGNDYAEKFERTADEYARGVSPPPLPPGGKLADHSAMSPRARPHPARRGVRSRR